MFVCALFLFAQAVHPLYIYPPRHESVTEPMRNPDVFPHVIKRVAPEYPEVARKARIAGIVLLEVVVKKNGHVGDVQVLKPLPFGLDQKAVEAVRKWRFAPAKYHGKTVAAYYRCVVNFRPD